MIALLLFCLLSQTHVRKVSGSNELWKDSKYLKRMNKATYVHINLYKMQNIAHLDAREPNYLRDIVVKSMQSYAWHNIKLIVDKFEFTTFGVNTKLIDFMCDKFGAFLKEASVAQGYHMLFTYQGYIEGGSKMGFYCYTAAVTQIAKEEKLDRLTDHITLSHELGHTLGIFNHITLGSSSCIEPQRGCIMREFYSEWPESLPYPPAFTVKGFEVLKTTLNNYRKDDSLVSHVNIAPFQVCGNGIVDPGEECDCAFEANCILSGQYECCDINTCKFKEGVKCYPEKCVVMNGQTCGEKKICMNKKCVNAAGYGNMVIIAPFVIYGILAIAWLVYLFVGWRKEAKSDASETSNQKF